MEKMIRDITAEARRLDVPPYELVPNFLEGRETTANRWSHPSFDSVRQRLSERDEYLLTPLEVEEGVTQCGACGSKRVLSFSRQTRSADEPMTTFSHCTGCGKKWSFAG